MNLPNQRYNATIKSCHSLLTQRASLCVYKHKERFHPMKLNGTHKFKAPGQHVYNAILNPQVLKECIPGCDSVEYLDANSIKANVTTPLPGLRGPYGAVIRITQRQEPSMLVLEVQRKGRAGS